MPRPPRLHVPGGHYHVVLRGNHREALFSTAGDRRVLDDIVADALTDQGARVHAYCWMTNHLHALVQIGDRPLGGLMHRIAVRYSRFRHRALDTVGHLFERRYRARLVDVDGYFLAVLRYVHLNPVKATLVTDPAQYPWSSHRTYLGLELQPWVTTGFGLSLFSTDECRARTAYAQFMSATVGNDEPEDAIANSHGDSNVIGTGASVARRPALRESPRAASTLAELVDGVCARHGITSSIIRSRAALRSLTPIRLEIARAAVEQQIATLTEVARFLGRDPSTLCQLMKRHPPNPR